jgi:hypothetical protein
VSDTIGLRRPKLGDRGKTAAALGIAGLRAAKVV